MDSKISWNTNVRLTTAHSYKNPTIYQFVGKYKGISPHVEVVIKQTYYL